MLDLCPAPRRAFFVFHSWGGVPNLPYFFHCKKDPAGRTLQAAPCGRPLQKASTPSFYSWSCTPNLPFFFSSQKKKAKRLAPRAAVRRTNLFLSGHFTTFHSWGGALNPPFFFSLQKKKAKRLAPREAIKFIFIRAFYNSLRSDK